MSNLRNAHVTLSILGAITYMVYSWGAPDVLTSFKPLTAYSLLHTPGFLPDLYFHLARPAPFVGLRTGNSLSTAPWPTYTQEGAFWAIVLPSHMLISFSIGSKSPGCPGDLLMFGNFFTLFYLLIL